MSVSDERVWVRSPSKRRDGARRGGHPSPTRLETAMGKERRGISICISPKLWRPSHRSDAQTAVRLLLRPGWVKWAAQADGWITLLSPDGATDGGDRAPSAPSCAGVQLGAGVFVRLREVEMEVLNCSLVIRLAALRLPVLICNPTYSPSALSCLLVYPYCYPAFHPAAFRTAFVRLVALVSRGSR